jgi:hypothetical protein
MPPPNDAVLARKDALLRQALEAMVDFTAGSNHAMSEAITAIVHELQETK